MTTDERRAAEGSLVGEPRRPGPGTRFFLWCAGGESELLEHVPSSETTKQVGFGTLVLIPAVLAAFSMSYALSTLTDRALVVAGGAALWSLIVFAFDRFIVSSFRKSRGVLLDVTSPVFACRLLFALFVGVIVAHPLTLLCFRQSLDERLAFEQTAARRQVAAGYEQRRDALDEQILALERELQARERQRDAYRERLVAEIDGIVTGRTTGIPGRGASAEEKERQLRAAELEVASFARRTRARIETLASERTALAAESTERQAATVRSTDYLARVEALRAVAAESPHVGRVHLFLVLFFIFVDTLPIVFKGFTPRGPYDVLLQAEEARSMSWARARAQVAVGREPA